MCYMDKVSQLLERERALDAFLSTDMSIKLQSRQVSRHIMPPDF